MQLLARAQNVVRNVIKLGGLKQDEGELQLARAHLDQALAVATQIGNARPNTFGTVHTGMNAMEDSYAGLARLAEAIEDPDLGRWRGEIGVLYIGRQDLHGVLLRYTQHVDEDPPASIEDLLTLQARSVAYTMMGIGLSPTEKPEVLRKPEPSDKTASTESEEPLPSSVEQGPCAE
jgi:hypothetical protein